MYKLEVELDGIQARVVINALDLFARIHMGQIDAIANVLSEGDYTPEQIDNVRSLCKEIKTELGHHANGSYGIYNSKVPVDGRAAWDIQCVIRKAIAEVENHSPHSVWHHGSLHAAKEVPLIKCTIQVIQQEKSHPLFDEGFG
jgi:hypothetical protein